MALTVGLSLLYPQGTIIARQATDSLPQTGDRKAEWEKEESDLARKTQNPISDLISVPIQTNINFGYGPQDNTQVIINIQPVILFRLGPDWNLVTRTIIPLTDQPIPDRKFGLGDIQLSLFASPSKPGKFIWGSQFGQRYDVHSPTPEERCARAPSVDTGKARQHKDT